MSGCYNRVSILGRFFQENNTCFFMSPVARDTLWLTRSLHSHMVWGNERIKPLHIQKSTQITNVHLNEFSQKKHPYNQYADEVYPT